MTLDMIKGFRVVVVPPVSQSVKRSWRERLLSWTPWVSHKTVWHEVMNDKDVIFDYQNRAVYMSLSVKLNLEKALAAKNEK